MTEQNGDNQDKKSFSDGKITLKNIDLGKLKKAMDNYRGEAGLPSKPQPQKPQDSFVPSFNQAQSKFSPNISLDIKITKKPQVEQVLDEKIQDPVLPIEEKKPEKPTLSESSIRAQQRYDEERKRAVRMQSNGIIDLNAAKKRPEKPLAVEKKDEKTPEKKPTINQPNANQFQARSQLPQKAKPQLGNKSKRYDDEQESARKKRLLESGGKSRANNEALEDDAEVGGDYRISQKDIDQDEEKFFGKALTFASEKSYPVRLNLPKRKRKGVGRYEEVVRNIEISGQISVKDLADLMSEKIGDVLKALIKEGIASNINASLDPDVAEIIATSMGHSVVRVEAKNPLELIMHEAQNLDCDEKRIPIVAIMGHVDHGKTSLLDYIRKKNVAAKEAGGITQHIGAYTVDSKLGKITFLDTPGHAAFSKMRSRGANLTDISILIVAADDGIQEQTIEAIKHIKASSSVMLVVINKVDKADADVGKIKQDLLRYDVLLEEFGGEIICVEVSAKTGLGVDKLLETISLQAEMLDLSCSLKSRAFGVVIESKFDKNLGSIATIILKHGKLSIGDIFIAGKSYAKIKYMTNDAGDKVKTLEPGIPVEVFGFESSPSAGESVAQMDNEKHARSVMEIFDNNEKESKNQKPDIAALLAAQNGIDRKNVNIILKTDAFGSLEAISEMIETIVHPELNIKIISKGVGSVTESDIVYAKSSGASVVCFNVSADQRGKIAMQKEKIDIKTHSIVYKLLDDVKLIASSKLGMIRSEKFVGKAEIKQIFETKTEIVAGCYVADGSVLVGAIAKIIKKGKDDVSAITSIKMLKRFKDVVKEVKSGHECGIMFSDKIKFETGDVIHVYEEEFKTQEI